MILFLIAFGGAAGSLLRYLVGGAIQRLSPSGFPVGTLFVNVVGCFLIGVFVRFLLHMQTSPGMRALLIVGNGYFKPNLATLVGGLYGENDPRRDGGFTIYYMGVNTGALLAPLRAMLAPR